MAAFENNWYTHSLHGLENKHELLIKCEKIHLNERKHIEFDTYNSTLNSKFNNIFQYNHDSTAFFAPNFHTYAFKFSLFYFHKN